MGEVVASFFSRLASMERICVGWSGRRMGHPGTGNEEETWVGLAGNRRNGQVRTTARQGDGTAGRKKPVGLFRYGHPRCEKKPVPQGWWPAGHTIIQRHSGRRGEETRLPGKVGKWTGRRVLGLLRSERAWHLLFFPQGAPAY